MAVRAPLQVGRLPSCCIAIAVVFAACAPAASDTREPGAPDVQLVASASVPGEFLGTGSVLALVDDHSAALVDEGLQQVYALDVPRGAVLWSVGRKGQGPGEFQGITEIFSDFSGRLVLLDALLRRVTVLGPEREVIATAGTPGVPGRVIAMQGDAIELDWLQGFSPRVGRLNVRTGDVGPSTDVFAADSSLAALDPGTGTVSPFLAFAPAPGGGFLVANPLRYAIRRFGADGQVHEFGGRPALKPAFPTPQELEARVKQMEARLQNAPPTSRPSNADIRAQMGKRPKPFFPAGGMTADRKGRLWVITTRGTGDTTVVDLFGTGGVYLRSLAFPQKFKRMAIRQGRLAFVRSLEDSPSEHAEVFLYEIRD